MGLLVCELGQRNELNLVVVRDGDEHGSNREVAVEYGFGQMDDLLKEFVPDRCPRSTPRSYGRSVKMSRRSRDREGRSDLENGVPTSASTKEPAWPESRGQRSHRISDLIFIDIPAKGRTDQATCHGLSDHFRRDGMRYHSVGIIEGGDEVSGAEGVKPRLVPCRIPSRLPTESRVTGS